MTDFEKFFEITQSNDDTPVKPKYYTKKQYYKNKYDNKQYAWMEEYKDEIDQEYKPTLLQKIKQTIKKLLKGL